MELRHLLYFKVVAEELHFRKAAEKLHISQPPLSRQIAELEAELGVRLLERSNKKVALTDAGRYFKKEVDNILSSLEECRQKLRLMQGAVSGQLRIGYISSTYQEHLTGILKEIKTAFPFVKTKLYEVPTIKQLQALEEGKLDVGILRAPVKSDKLKVISLFNDPFVAVTASARDFRPASQEELAAYLKRQPFIFFNQEYAPDFYEKLVELCQRMGFYPDVQHEANNINSILRLVEGGLGVSLVPRSIMEHYKSDALSFHELQHAGIATEVVLAYKAPASHPATEWFIEHYSAIVRQHT